MNPRWKYNPIYLRFKYACKQILLPLIIFQFVRCLILPSTFDVIILGVFAISYVAISLDWV